MSKILGLLKNKFVLIGLAVLLLGGGAGAFFLTRGKAEPEKESASADKHGKEGKSEKPGTPPALVDLETFLVNLADDGGDRYAKVSIKLAVHPAEVASVVKEDELARARLRDRILTVLAAKTYEELSTPLGKEGLRKELQVQLQPLLAAVLEGEGKAKDEEPVSIEELLFGDFVVQ